jgi:hypothetical protein
MQIYNRNSRHQMRYFLRLMRSGQMTQMDLWSAVVAMTFVCLLLFQVR